MHLFGNSLLTSSNFAWKSQMGRRVQWVSCPTLVHLLPHLRPAPGWPLSLGPPGTLSVCSWSFPPSCPLIRPVSWAHCWTKVCSDLSGAPSLPCLFSLQLHTPCGCLPRAQHKIVHRTLLRVITRLSQSCLSSSVV